MRTLLVVIVSMLAGMAMAAEPVDWKVVSVHDGDTFKAVESANVQHKARLQGIDASEVK
jgi:endonuclease YncB( thermonuclease family)